jgi:hypothetical protein
MGAFQDALIREQSEITLCDYINRLESLASVIEELKIALDGSWKPLGFGILSCGIRQLQL